MEIPRSLVRDLTEKLNKLSDSTRALVLADLSEIKWTSIAELREKTVDVVDSYLSYATDIASQYSADSFDAIRLIAVGEELGAEPVSGYDSDAVDGSIRAFVQDVVSSGDTGSFFENCLSRCDYDIKRSAAFATAYNCSRDPLRPKWARIPTGAETCMFCLMLSSRGFVYSSESNAGGHWHAKCDCRAIQGYDGMKVAGYDPNAYLEQWYRSDHYEYMKMRAKRLSDANFIRYVQKLKMKSGATAKQADILTRKIQMDFKEKYGKDYSDVFRKSKESAYRATLGDGTKIGDFVDVQAYLRDSKSKRDLEHRYSMLINAYGTKSEIVKSTAMKNALRHVEKRIAGTDIVNLNSSSASIIRDNAASLDKK